MAKKAFCVLLIWLGLAGPLFPRTHESAASGFDKLRALAGEWEGTVAWTGKTASEVSAHYYVTGNGSAVVEDLSNGMSSVYLSFAKSPASFKISKIPQRRVTCYLDEIQAAYAIIAVHRTDQYDPKAVD